ncbi:MAG: LPS-assembly protein LptD [Firmicutes bacterium]|nr:LPS-assembly protein LptD [Bacillota bacterium]
MASRKSLVATSICVILLALIALTPLAFGSEQRVRIVARETGSYDLEQQIFVAQGDVQVTYGELILMGDKLQVNLSTGELVLEGGVRLRQEDQELRGEYLSFDLESGEGVFSRARAEIMLPEETGIVYLAGESISLSEEKYTLSQGEFTTCDLEESHFRLVTKELELIPDEKIVIRGVTYYEGKIPLFYWPYLVIPLDTDANRFSLPEVGYSEHEGYYIKNAFNYYHSSSAHGQVYLDLFTRLGVGLGVRHNYDLDSWGTGSIYLYGIPTSPDLEYKGAFSHKVTKENWGFQTNTTLHNTWLKKDLTSDNRVTLSLPNLNAETWFKIKRTPTAQTLEERDLGLYWSQNLTDNWRFNLRGNITERQTAEVLRLVDYLASTSYRQGKHRVTLTMQQQFNPDLLESSTQPWRSVQRIPELKWEVSDLGIPKLPLQSQLVWGHYGERPSLITKNRVYGQIGLKQQVWQPTSGTSISYQGDVNSAAYSGGGWQTWTYGRMALTQKFTSNLQLTGTFRRRDVWGESPFRFDAQRPLQDLTLRLGYNDSKWNVNVNNSYDFLTRRFGTVTLQANYRPNQIWNLNLYASYDPNNNTRNRIVPLVEYKKDKVDLGLGVRYQPASQVLERVDARISVPVGSTWQVSYDSIFEPPKQVFTRGQITVTKDLHCRSLSVSYDHVVQRVALQYTINAFPTLPIGWDSQDGLSLFDLEEVSDIIGVKE